MYVFHLVLILFASNRSLVTTLVQSIRLCLLLGGGGRGYMLKLVHHYIQSASKDLILVGCFNFNIQSIYLQFNLFSYFKQCNLWSIKGSFEWPLLHSKWPEMASDQQLFCTLADIITTCLIYLNTTIIG